MLGVSSPPTEEPSPPIGRHPVRDAHSLTEHMLLVASQGRQPSGGHQLRIASVGDPADALIVDVTEVSPGPGCVATGVITSPYHVVRVAGSDKPVRFVRHPKENTCED